MSKVWFITGCSKGFGYVLTKELLENTKDIVVATARKTENLDNLKATYDESRLLVLPLDVTQNNQIQTAVSKTLELYQKIDILVNNAGYGLVGALEECSEAQIRAQFDTNVFGLMEMTRAVLPTMRKQNKGHIFNFSSVAGRVGMPGAGIYNSSKFAIEGFSEALKYDIEAFNIHVTIIEPGPFRTDFAGGSIQKGTSMREYDNTAAASIRTYMQETNQTQPGCPLKASKLIIALSKLEQPPLRIPMGKIALERIYAHNARDEAELKQYEQAALNTDFI